MTNDEGVIHNLTVIMAGHIVTIFCNYQSIVQKIVTICLKMRVIRHEFARVYNS